MSVPLILWEKLFYSRIYELQSSHHPRQLVRELCSSDYAPARKKVKYFQMKDRRTTVTLKSYDVSQRPFKVSMTYLVWRCFICYCLHFRSCATLCIEKWSEALPLGRKAFELLKVARDIFSPIPSWSPVKNVDWLFILFSFHSYSS